MILGLTPEQKAARRKFIGGSDALAIVTGEWTRLWEIKTGRREDDDLSDILPVMMGHATEPFNRFWYTKQTGREITHDGTTRMHPTLPYLGCTLDGLTTTSGGEPASWQAKHVGKSGDQMILRYTAQCTHEALCCGVDWWVMSTFVGNSKWELVEQEVDPFWAQDYLAKCEDFWSWVENDSPPPASDPLPVPRPRALRIVRLEGEPQEWWPNWGPAMLDELASYARTLGSFKSHVAARENIKALMPEDVGTVIRDRIKVARDKAGAVRVSISKEDEKL
jgi:hypothetical protein